jgi:hypothetical protein
MRRLLGLNHLRVPSRLRQGTNGHRLGLGREWLGRLLRLRLRRVRQGRCQRRPGKIDWRLRET